MPRHRGEILTPRSAISLGLENCYPAHVITLLGSMQ
jgi:hypothetical protein